MYAQSSTLPPSTLAYVLYERNTYPAAAKLYDQHYQTSNIKNPSQNNRCFLERQDKCTRNHTITAVYALFVCPTWHPAARLTVGVLRGGGGTTHPLGGFFYIKITTNSIDLKF